MKTCFESSRERKQKSNSFRVREGSNGTVFVYRETLVKRFHVFCWVSLVEQEEEEEVETSKTTAFK